ncbi:MAG TPA: hypothetical protein VK582_14755 [Pyrinomonadaceae bacterium]|nr:hypothetical protein [Pyrinomonadaceae bacterium]
MATKKAPSARKSTRSRKRAAKLSLAVVAANQKEINGSVYEALDLILDCIRTIVPAGDRSKLRQAQAIIEAIPGYDPPGCGAGPYPG